MADKNPDIIETLDGFEKKGAVQTRDLRASFFQCYAIIMEQEMEWVQRQLLKMGRWPYEWIAIRVLDWEEAVTRLKRDEDCMMAMTRMVVAIEDPEGKLYLVRTPDLVAGQRDVHRAPDEVNVQEAVDAAFKLN